MGLPRRPAPGCASPAGPLPNRGQGQHSVPVVPNGMYSLCLIVLEVITTLGAKIKLCYMTKASYLGYEH